MNGVPGVRPTENDRHHHPFFGQFADRHFRTTTGRLDGGLEREVGLRVCRLTARDERDEQRQYQLRYELSSEACPPQISKVKLHGGPVRFLCPGAGVKDGTQAALQIITVVFARPGQRYESAWRYLGLQYLCP